MTRFGAVEAQTGGARYIKIPGLVELTQREAGGDLRVKLAAEVTQEMIENLQGLITSAYGNPPLPEIEISVKAEAPGEIILNEQEIVWEILTVNSGSLVNFLAENNGRIQGR